jgi:hypothetical protein
MKTLKRLRHEAVRLVAGGQITVVFINAMLDS